MQFCRVSMKSVSSLQNQDTHLYLYLLLDKVRENFENEVFIQGPVRYYSLAMSHTDKLNRLCIAHRYNN